MPNDDQNWRFKGFENTGGGAYNRTLAISTPQSRALFSAAPKLNAASRIGNPTNTNWDSTFQANNPASPSGTDWQKTFSPVWARNNEPTGQNAGNSGDTGKSFSFSLSPSVDRAQLTLGTDTTDFYKDRVASMDLTSKDHEMYGAGKDYGFAF